MDQFDLENPLANNSQQDFDSDINVPSLFLVESEHTPSENYYHKLLKARDLDIFVRRETISLISQFSCNFDPLILYLAINYLDRFLSTQELLTPRPWILRLTAISCVSLAAKMNKKEFSLTEIQGDGGIILDTRSIKRMEFLILAALKWRMRSITPFSFIPFFTLLFKLEDPSLMEALKARAAEIIIKSQSEIKVLAFKPSIIASSALLFASQELLPLQNPRFRKAISSCSYVNKEDLSLCCNSMQDIAIFDGYESVSDMVSCSVTPVNVLDRHFLRSEESEKTNETPISATNCFTLGEEKDIKRRKLGGYGRHNQRVQISQIQRC